jgi:hypothetical protein
MSTDRGDTWVSIADGLDQFQVRVLAVSPHEPMLWAGTSGSGIARVSIAHLKGEDPDWQGITEKELDSIEAVGTRRSSPASVRTGTRGVRFDPVTGMLWVPVRGKARIELFDAAGRQGLRREIEAHDHVQINVKGLAARVYVARISDLLGTREYRFSAVR